MKSKKNGNVLQIILVYFRLVLSFLVRENKNKSIKDEK
jgi:hypothetical protein